MTVMLVTLPILLVIFSGMITGKCKFLGEDAPTLLARLIFYIVMPITLFFDISKLNIAQILIWDYMLAYFFSYICIVLISVIFSRYVYNRNVPNIIINAMASAHGNTAYVALPLFLIAFKTAAPVASIIIVQVIFNFMILFGLDSSTNRRSGAAGYYTYFLLS